MCPLTATVPLSITYIQIHERNQLMYDMLIVPRQKQRHSLTNSTRTLQRREFTSLFEGLFF